MSQRPFGECREGFALPNTVFWYYKGFLSKSLSFVNGLIIIKSLLSKKLIIKKLFIKKLILKLDIKNLLMKNPLMTKHPGLPDFP